MTEPPGFSSPAIQIIKAIAWSKLPFADFPRRFSGGLVGKRGRDAEIDIRVLHQWEEKQQYQLPQMSLGPSSQTALQPAPVECASTSKSTARGEEVASKPAAELVGSPGDHTACPQPGAGKGLL